MKVKARPVALLLLASAMIQCSKEEEKPANAALSFLSETRKIAGLHFGALDFGASRSLL